MESLRITIIGSGYVGLVTGTCLAARGHRVVCVDAKPEIIDGLNRGTPHYYEPDLAELLASVIASGNFRATTSIAEGIESCDLVFLAVGTPSENGRIDLNQVRAAAEAVGAELRKQDRFVSVVVKSTVLPGVTDTVVRECLERASGLPLGRFGLGMNPEFLREGSAVLDFMEADRVVIGSEDEETRSRLERVYSSWSCEKLAVNTRTAEMIKYVNNCLLATQISAMNEFANLAGALGGIDMMDVLEGVSLDGRWSPRIEGGRRIRPGVLKYLVPGCGFGGSCFPKDVQALRSQGVELGFNMELLEAVLSINDRQPEELVALWARQAGNLAGKRALVLGLAFKEGTDDVRESPSARIIRRLTGEGVSVTAHDPVAAPNARRAWPDLRFECIDDWREAVAEADAVFIVTRWPEYLELASSAQRSRLDGKVVVDARRLLSPDQFPESVYLTVGRGELARAAAHI